MQNPAMCDQLAALRPTVLAICRSRLPYADADDAAQETLISLWRLLAADPELLHASLTGLACRIAHRRITDIYRSRARDRGVLVARMPDPVSGVPGPEDRVVVGWVFDALAGVTGPQRRVLFHRMVMGESANDTAELLGMNANAVRQRQYKAIRTMRAELAGVAA